MSVTHRLLFVLATIAWAASCSSTQVHEIESRLSPDGRYRATLTSRSRNTARGFVVQVARPGEQPDPVGVFQTLIPRDSDLDRLTTEKVVTIGWESTAVLVVSYEEWLKPDPMRESWETVSIRYERRPGARR
jgi:hypothetical protein